jgi:hypothetical protein
MLYDDGINLSEMHERYAYKFIPGFFKTQGLTQNKLIIFSFAIMDENGFYLVVAHC